MKKVSALLIALFPISALAVDADFSFGFGLGAESNQTILALSAGPQKSGIRFNGQIALSNNRDVDGTALADNEYNYTVGAGYRWNVNGWVFQAGALWFQNEIDLLRRHQVAFDGFIGYRYKSCFTGWKHNSVPFSDDHGLDFALIGCSKAF